MTARSTLLDARYGRSPDRRRRRLVVAATVAAALAAAAIAWAVWTGIGGSTTALEVTTTSVSVDGDAATTVRWLVTGRAGTPVVCAIQAQDASGVIVGLDEVSVPAGDDPNRSGTTVVRTVRRASTGLIASCRDA